MFGKIDFGERLDIIEALRFFAAMAVVCRHIPVIGIGDFGVDIFFVISGFVMMLSTERSTSQFFLKRVIRIAPTYWFFTFGVFCLALLAPSLLNNTTADYSQLFKSLFFIPFDKNGTGHWPVLPLGWTLNYEMYFYLLFSLALLISHKNRAVMVVFLVAGLMFLAGLTENYPFTVYGNLVVLEFALGVLAFMIVCEKSVFRVAAVVLIIVASAVIHEAGTGHRFIRFGLPAFALVTICVFLFSKVRMPGYVVTLGGASYALYLTHYYFVRVFEKLTGLYEGSAAEQVIATLVTILIVNLVAVAIYKFMEVPIGRFLRRLLLAKPQKTDFGKDLNLAP